MLKVRLQRTGKRGQAYFRGVILEHTQKPKGKFLELLGNYDPHRKELNAKIDRIEYWVSKGAQVSPTVNNLLVNYKYWNKPKMPSWKPKKSKEPMAKSQEQVVKTDEKRVETPAVKTESPVEPQPETMPTT